jgi:hypothetical protein
MDQLKGILTDGFLPSLCPEYGLNKHDDDAMVKHLEPARYTAIVCFCDLLLPLISQHMDDYGEFGIGLTKEWGIKQGLEPVIYSHPQGQTRAPIAHIAEVALGLKYKDIETDLKVLSAYTKRYSGGVWRNERYLGEIEFYNEREWRYVALHHGIDPVSLSREEMKDDGLRESMVKFRKKYSLQFTPDDIQYLIVPNDDFVVGLHPFLKGKFGDRDGILLTFAIITADRLRMDT